MNSWSREGVCIITVCITNNHITERVSVEEGSVREEAAKEAGGHGQEVCDHRPRHLQPAAQVHGAGARARAARGRGDGARRRRQGRRHLRPGVPLLVAAVLGPGGHDDGILLRVRGRVLAPAAEVSAALALVAGGPEAVLVVRVLAVEDLGAAALVLHHLLLLVPPLDVPTAEGGSQNVGQI